MTNSEARIWIVKSSLVILTFYIAFFSISPAVNYPISYSQSLSIIEIVVPLFLGYLTAAVSSLRAPVENNIDPKNSDMLKILTKGPIFIVGACSVLIFVVFGVTNWRVPGPQTGTGMSFDTLRTLVATLLSVLTATTGVLVGSLFGSRNAE